MNLEIHKELLDFIDRKDFSSLQQSLEDLNPADISNVLIRFNEDEICQILSGNM